MAKGEEFMESKHDREEEDRAHRASGGHAGHHKTHGGARMASGGEMDLNTEGPHPGHPTADEGRHDGDKKGGATHRRRRSGGKSEDGQGSVHDKVQEYNAQGSNEMKEASDETPGFKAGGHKKRRRGGNAEGAMAEKRLDRRPRRAMGGKAGHNPYSSAAAFTSPLDSAQARGFEGKVKGG